MLLASNNEFFNMGLDASEIQDIGLSEKYKIQLKALLSATEQDFYLGLMAKRAADNRVTSALPHKPEESTPTPASEVPTPERLYTLFDYIKSGAELSAADVECLTQKLTRQCRRGTKSEVVALLRNLPGMVNRMEFKQIRVYPSILIVAPNALSDRSACTALRELLLIS